MSKLNIKLNITSCGLPKYIKTLLLDVFERSYNQGVQDTTSKYSHLIEENERLKLELIELELKHFDKLVSHK